MADMFAPLVAQLKANPKTIVFTEGNDPRILEAASKLLAEGVLKVVMVGNEAECKAAAAAGNFDISAAEIIDPENYAGFDEMVNTMVELRKGKQTAEECTAMLKKSNYFGTMLVKMGKADCLLGGATYSTADTIRPALQLVKTKKGAHRGHRQRGAAAALSHHPQGDGILPGHGGSTGRPVCGIPG